jgi:hypothetical protein
MEQTPPEFCVYDLPPHEYMGCLLLINEKYIEDDTNALKGIKLKPSQAAIVVGSDGKLERHAQSSTEFVFLATPTNPQIDISKIHDSLARYNVAFFPSMTGGIEQRIVGGNETLSYFENDRGRVHPDRILNSMFIGGDWNTYQAARLQILEEMTSDGEDGKRIRGRLADQLKTYKHTIKSGISRERQVFDVETATQYYDEGENAGFGFKHAQIRAVQAAFNLLIVRAIRKGKVSISEIATNMHSRTYDKFEYCEALGLLDQNIAAPAQTAYAWFLREYHRVQEEYKDTHRPVALRFNRDEFNKHNAAIAEFLNGVFKSVSEA